MNREVGGPRTPLRRLPVRLARPPRRFGRRSPAHLTGDVQDHRVADRQSHHGGGQQGQTARRLPEVEAPHDLDQHYGVDHPQSSDKGPLPERHSIGVVVELDGPPQARLIVTSLESMRSKIVLRLWGRCLAPRASCPGVGADEASHPALACGPAPGPHAVSSGATGYRAASLMASTSSPISALLAT